MTYYTYSTVGQLHDRPINKVGKNVSNYYNKLQVMNLHMNLLEAAHRNEELQEILMQKDQQIEQQDKTSRSQATVIKVNKLY